MDAGRRWGRGKCHLITPLLDDITSLVRMIFCYFEVLLNANANVIRYHIFDQDGGKHDEIGQLGSVGS